MGGSEDDADDDALSCELGAIVDHSAAHPLDAFPAAGLAQVESVAASSRSMDRSRSLYFWILPVTVIGKSSVTWR